MPGKGAGEGKKGKEGVEGMWTISERPISIMVILRVYTSEIQK